MLLPYHKRLCPCCHVVDDEMHAIFHCKLYQHERTKFADLFRGDQNLRFFLASNPTHRVALFLVACKSAAAQQSQPVPRALWQSDLALDGFEMNLTDRIGDVEVDRYDSD